MKNLLLSITSLIVIVMVLTGCAPTASNWDYNLKLNRDGVNYLVTKAYLTEPGKKIDTIRYYGHGEQYDLYSVTGVSESRAICINTAKGFLLALGDSK